MASVKPVFIKRKNIPGAEENPTTIEICQAAEKTTGKNSILGAQEIRGLWRLYPNTIKARQDLLIQGITIRNTRIQPHDNNPFILRDDTGEEKASTKLWIDDLPLSVANSGIEEALAKLGCETRSRIQEDRARDADGKLTRFLTGRRFIFITVPPTPLPKSIRIEPFTARLYHKEQKTEKTVICSNCLEDGHHRSSCEKEVVCRSCKKPGHKQGDQSCTMTSAGRPTDVDAPSTPSKLQQTGKKGTGSKPAVQGDDNAGTRASSRTRPLVRQTTLRSTMELDRQSRSRSATPKRRRSRESPKDRSVDKQPRREKETKQAARQQQGLGH